MNNILNTIKTIGFVVNTELEDQEKWVLACNPEKETIGPVVDLFLLDRKSANDTLTQPLIDKLSEALENQDIFKLSVLFDNAAKLDTQPSVKQPASIYTHTIKTIAM